MRQSAWATAKEVDEGGRIEKNRRQLPDAAFISPPLVANPSAGILVPFVTAVRDGAERRLEQFPAAIVIQRALDRTRDVGTAATSAYPAVEFPDDFVAESYLHTHGHKLAHCSGQKTPRPDASGDELDAPRTSRTPSRTPAGVRER